MKRDSMQQPAQLDRRSFLAMAGATAACAPSLLNRSGNGPGYAFLSCTRPTGCVEVYAVHNRSWGLRHSIPAESPISLAVQSSGSHLYVLHDVQEFQGLPRGYVESYRVALDSGRLTLLSQQPLSLSATRPRHLSIAPDGKSLIASIHGGGAYNLLPILEDGRAGRVHLIRKETGSGPILADQLSAHPQAAIYDHSGRHLITADLGTDTINILAADSLHVLSRCLLPAGSGPRHLVLHPSGRFVFTACALSGALLNLSYNGAAQIGPVQQSLSLESGGPLALHPSGQTLYATCSDGLIALNIDDRTGCLHPLQRIRIPAGVQALAVSANGDALFVATQRSVIRMEIDLSSGCAGLSTTVADTSGAHSLVLT